MVIAPGGNMENISGTEQKPQNCYRGYRHTTPSPTQSSTISPTLHITSALFCGLLSWVTSVIPVRALCRRACVFVWSVICIRFYIDDIYIKHTNNGINKNTRQMREARLLHLIFLQILQARGPDGWQFSNTCHHSFTVSLWIVAVKETYLLVKFTWHVTETAHVRFIQDRASAHCTPGY